MKRFLLSSAVVLAVAVVPVVGAWAQENTITIIHEDGSEDVIELGGKKVPDAAPVPKVAPRVEVETKPVVTPADVHALEPKKAVVEAEEAAEAIEEVAEPAPVKPSVERIAEPVSKPVSKKVEPVTAKKAVAKKVVPKKASPKKVMPKDELAFVPLRKPHRRVITQDTVITEEKALYIALSEAPPARDVQVIAQDGGYSVIFKTEKGPYEVFVNGASGVVEEAGYIEVTAPVTKPGHLPARPKAAY